MEKRDNINENNVYKIIKNYKQIIFDDKIWINQEMWKIAEVTYSYKNIITKSKKNIIINTTLFCNLGELKIDNFNEISEQEIKIKLFKAKEVLSKKINDKKEKIIKAIQELELIKKQKNISKEQLYLIEIFINSLIEKNYLLYYCLNGIPYELMKAGINMNLSKQKILNIDQKQREIDEKLFGGEIKNNNQEIVKCYEYIYKNYQKNKSNFTKQENIRFKYFLGKIEKLLDINYKYKEKKELKNLLDEFEAIQIQNKEYILGFNLFVESLENLKHIIKRDPDVKSVSDGPLGVLFPTSKKFDFITLKRFFTLNTHEIEVHSITDHNNEQIIGNIRGAGSTIKDEGLAILMENLLQYGQQLFINDKNSGKLIIDKEKMPIKNTFTFTLMGELLNNKELLEYLELTEKLEADNIEVKDRYNRLKRSNYYGIQHKDTSYIRGLFKAIDEINKYILSDGKQGIKVEDLFLGKISFEETYKFKAIKENKEKNNCNINILMPIFSSDAIIFSIKQQFDENSYYMQLKQKYFIDYLQKKYPIFSFSQQKINAISRKAKLDIIGISNIVIKNITETGIKKLNEKKLEQLLNIIYSNNRNTIDKIQQNMNPSRREVI